MVPFKTEAGRTPRKIKIERYKNSQNLLYYFYYSFIYLERRDSF